MAGNYGVIVGSLQSCDRITVIIERSNEFHSAYLEEVKKRVAEKMGWKYPKEECRHDQG